MPPPEPAFDIGPIKIDNIREVLRLSEVYLDATTKFAIASDSRAVTLSTMMATLMTATAALGAAIIALPTDPHSKFIYFLAVAAIAASLCFMMALVLASKAASPEPFDVPGNYLGSFTAGDLAGDPRHLLLEQAKIYQRQINLNSARLETNAALLKASLAWVKYSPLVAFLAGLAAIAAPASF